MNHEQTMERAATLWALAKLVETGEVGETGAAMSTIVNLDGDVVSVIPSLAMKIQGLGDRLFDTTYSEDLSEDEREEWFYSFIDGPTVPAIVEAIRLASLEDALAA